MMEPASLTPYPAVNAVLAELLAGVREVLGARLYGLYLYGLRVQGSGLCLPHGST
jgi:hypothetical protein